MLTCNEFTVEDIYRPDLTKEAISVFGDDDIAHPSVAYLHTRVKEYYLGGKVQAIQAPTHFDYVALRCESTNNEFINFEFIHSSHKIHRRNFVHTLRSLLGAKSSLSRPVIPCTVLIESSPSVPPESGRPIY